MSQPSIRIVGEPGNESAAASACVATSRSSIPARPSSTSSSSWSASGCDRQPFQKKNSTFIGTNGLETLGTFHSLTHVTFEARLAMHLTDLVEPLTLTSTQLVRPFFPPQLARRLRRHRGADAALCQFARR